MSVTKVYYTKNLEEYIRLIVRQELFGEKQNYIIKLQYDGRKKKVKER